MTPVCVSVLYTHNERLSVVNLFDLQRELATQTHELVLFLSEELSNEGRTFM